MKIGIWAGSGQTLSGGTGIAFAHNTSPFVTAYPWNSISGFGAKHANPAILPPGEGFGVEFTPNSADMVLAHAVTPFSSAYKWSLAGFGTKYANPASLLPNTATCVRIRNRTGATNYQAFFSHNMTPFVSAYQFSKTGGGFGTRFSNPAVLAAGNGNSLSISRSLNAILLSHANSPFVSAWTVSDTAFGTKYSNPPVLPSSAGTGAALSAGSALVRYSLSSPYVIAWNWSDAGGFGTKYADPGFTPEVVGSNNEPDFHFTNSFVAIPQTTSGGRAHVGVWNWADGTGFLSHITPQVFPPGTGFTGRGAKFNPIGTILALASSFADYAFAWPFAAGFGTAFIPASGLPSTGNSVAFAN